MTTNDEYKAQLKQEYCERKHAFCPDCRDKLPDNTCFRCLAQNHEATIAALEARVLELEEALHFYESTRNYWEGGSLDDSRIAGDKGALARMLLRKPRSTPALYGDVIQAAMEWKRVSARPNVNPDTGMRTWHAKICTCSECHLIQTVEALEARMGEG